MNKSIPNGCALLYFIGWLSVIVSWIINLIKLINCDFDAPYKEEILHLIDVCIPGASLITCWF